MVELVKHKMNENMNILFKRQISNIIFNYLHDSRVKGYHLDAL